jgi:anthranilate/para-aminobenzoate synthase component I
MAIIDALEGRPRGVYSGSISTNDCFDLNMVIRTAVLQPQCLGAAGHRAGERADSSAAGGVVGVAAGAAPFGAPSPACGSGELTGSGEGAGSGWVLSVGAGGAVVVQSDPAAEFSEMLLKARPLLAAVAACDAEAARGRRGSNAGHGRAVGAGGVRAR